MKRVFLLGAIVCASQSTVFAQSAAHDAILAQFKSRSEPAAKDALWTSPKMFKVGVLNNGTNRDGYAQYVCGEIAAAGLKGVSVQIIDIAKLKSTGKWVQLGQKHCG